MEFKHMPINGANYTNEDIKRLLDGKFVLPSKLDLTSYVSDIQQNKPENKNNYQKNPQLC